MTGNKPILAGLAILLGMSGCTMHEAERITSVPDPEQNLSAAAADPLTSAERLVENLVRADQAYTNADPQELTIYLDRIDRQGARLVDDSGLDYIAEWRQMAPAAGPPMRGRALGPAYMRGLIEPQNRVSTNQIFLSGKAVSISVGANPKLGLELTIRNADNKIICERSRSNSRECRFIPTFTQRYAIELHNAGDANARYFLVIN